MTTKQDELCVRAVHDLICSCLIDTDVPPEMVSMNSARILYTLWTRIMKYNPQNPEWYARDRFVMGAGVNAIVQYVMLFLAGYDITLEQLKCYRQLGSITPGHPEAGKTPGVEVTVGSFGEGLGAAVGMAMAERHQAARFNRPRFSVIDNFTYAVLYDGDLQEGISHEAASLAGHLHLGKLICLLNWNSEASTRRGFLQDSDDICARFRSYGWTVLNADGSDLNDIANQVSEAQSDLSHPTLIIVFGEDTNEIFSRDLLDKTDFVPDNAVLRYFAAASESGREAERQWSRLLLAYRNQHPELWQQLHSEIAGMPLDVKALNGTDSLCNEYISATDASKRILTQLGSTLPNLFGGVCSLVPDPGYIAEKDFSTENPSGKTIRFGNREQGMGAVLTGLASYGGLLVYGMAFLVLSDYMRPSIRIAAMMGKPLVYILMNDSVWNGQDGPTHQPIEQLAAMRAVPGLTVIRPADAAETVDAWKYILSCDVGPVALVLSKHPLLPLTRERVEQNSGLMRGAYVLYESRPDYSAILIATGSEVSLAVDACAILESEGIGIRVVNMPSWELFERQSLAYKQRVLPPECPIRVSIEAGSSQGWERYVGSSGCMISMESFGISAQPKDLLQHFGFSPEQIARVVIEALQKEEVRKQFGMEDKREKIYQ